MVSSGGGGGPPLQEQSPAISPFVGGTLHYFTTLLSTHPEYFATVLDSIGTTLLKNSPTPHTGPYNTTHTTHPQNTTRATLLNYYSFRIEVHTCQCDL